MTDHDAPASQTEEWAEAGVRLEVAGELATVTLCRPERRNAQSPAMWRALAAIGRELPGTVRVVVLRAEGVSFSAGLNRQAFTPEGIPGEVSFIEIAKGGNGDAVIAEYQEGFLWWRRPDLVTIAAVQGHAVGAGFQLALSCDLRVVAEDVQFAMKETALGLVPDLTGSKPLVDIVGLPRALEMCLTARTVEASEARELGLAELVVPAGRLDAAVADLTAALLATDAATARAVKKLLGLAPRNTLEEQSAAERRIQTELQRERLGG